MLCYGPQVDASVTWDSVGGMDHYIRALKEMVFLPLVYPELFERFNVQPPRGVLFYGPPGTGERARGGAGRAPRDQIQAPVATAVTLLLLPLPGLPSQRLCLPCHAADVARCPALCMQDAGAMLIAPCPPVPFPSPPMPCAVQARRWLRAPSPRTPPAPAAR